MKVRVLGELEVVGPGEVALDVSGARLRRLVTRLAADADRIVGASELVDAVWGDEPPADPVGALQTLVSRLRRALGSPALVQQAHQGYRLTVAPSDVDVGRFRRLVRQGREALAAGDPAAARPLLVEALALWRGPALADAEGADYAVALAARLEEERLDAVAARIDADLALGRAPEVVTELQDLARAHPLREHLTGQLMRALAAAGRGAEALAAYERLRSTLADTLGTDPSQALRDLHVRLLRDDVPDAPARDTASSRRPTLRPGLTSFLGREDEQARVLGLLGAGRLVTVVGPGGAGKTRISTEVGRAWQGEHGGGAVLVELAPVRDDGAVLPAFLGALDLREAHVLERTLEARRSTDDLSLLLAALADAPFLFVVDNCEHLLDPISRLVEELLVACPQLRVLATSREPLGIDGESLCVLPPLDLPPWDVTLADAPGYASVRLFVERAAAVHAGPVLDAGSLPAVVEIVRRLDGLPLAIELAAARTRVLPVAEVSARLSDRFRLLTGGRRTALPRHQTLRAVVEWSWDLMSADERLLAERLAVFPAGATPESATAVCADERIAADDVPPLLDALVDKSLLTVDEPTSERALRYRMLETIREFGVERLAERGEVEVARRRHADWFAEVVTTQTRQLYGREQAQGSRALDAERDNILAALRFLGDSGDASRTLRLALELNWWWSLRSAHTEARSWLEFARSVPGETEPGVREMVDAVILMTRGMVSDGAGSDAGPDDLEHQGQVASDALETTGVPDYVRPQSVVLRAMLAFFAHRPERAERLIAEALADENPWVRAATRMLRAAMAENDGDVATMRLDVDRAFSEFQEIGDRWGLATVLSIRAQLQTLDGDLTGALLSFGQAAEHLDALGAHSDEAYTRMRTATLRMRLGDVDGARRDVDEFRASNELGGFGELFSLGIRGLLAAQEGDVGTVREIRAALLEAEDDSRRRHRSQDHERALVLSILVLLDIELGELDEASTLAHDAYAAARATHDQPILANQGTTTARLIQVLGRDELAAEVLGACARVRGAEDATDLTITTVRESARIVLGDEAFEAAYRRGRDLDRDAAVARIDPASLELARGRSEAEAAAVTGTGQARRR